MDHLPKLRDEDPGPPVTQEGAFSVITGTRRQAGQFGPHTRPEYRQRTRRAQHLLFLALGIILVVVIAVALLVHYVHGG